MEHELGLTALFNNYLPGVGNAILGVFSLKANNPARPWEDSVVMELLVVALLMITAAIVRANLSVDEPGKLQHFFELLYEFFDDTLTQVGVHHPEKYLPYIGTLFIFILSMNLIGAIPAFEAPTMAPWVPAGLAIITFLYFNIMGFRAQGLHYFGHFAGPVRFPNPIANIAIILFMLPIRKPSASLSGLYRSLFVSTATCSQASRSPTSFWASPTW